MLLNKKGEVGDEVIRWIIYLALLIAASFAVLKIIKAVSS